MFVSLFVSNKSSGMHEANIRILEASWGSHINEIFDTSLIMDNFSRNIMWSCWMPANKGN